MAPASSRMDFLVVLASLNFHFVKGTWYRYMRIPRTAAVKCALRSVLDCMDPLVSPFQPYWYQLFGFTPACTAVLVSVNYVDLPQLVQLSWLLLQDSALTLLICGKSPSKTISSAIIRLLCHGLCGWAGQQIQQTFDISPTIISRLRGSKLHLSLVAQAATGAGWGPISPDWGVPTVVCC